MAHHLLQWLFRNRKTGAITVAQTPNLVLWIVIIAAILRWLWSTAGRSEIILTIIFQGALLVWAIDEIVRGVNPWRRFLGTAVAIYQLVNISTS